MLKPAASGDIADLLPEVAARANTISHELLCNVKRVRKVCASTHGLLNGTATTAD